MNGYYRMKAAKYCYGRVTDKSIRNFNKVLDILADSGNMTIFEIAEQLGLSISGARKILNRMLCEGLITAGGYRKNRLYGLITVQDDYVHEIIMKFNNDNKGQ